MDRRFKQNMETGINTSMEEIIENIKMRDYNDMHKPVGALIRTPEQIYIDSTNMTIPEVVEFILNKIKFKILKNNETPKITKNPKNKQSKQPPSIKSNQ